VGAGRFGSWHVEHCSTRGWNAKKKEKGSRCWACLENFVEAGRAEAAPSAQPAPVARPGHLHRYRCRAQCGPGAGQHVFESHRSIASTAASAVNSQPVEPRRLRQPCANRATAIAAGLPLAIVSLLPPGVNYRSDFLRPSTRC